jgi:signal transduction histidine kinase
MSSAFVAELIGLVALLTAITLYGMLLVMVLRQRGSHGPGLGGVDRLPSWTAVLGLAWNLGALTLLRPGHAEAGAGAQALVAVAYAALGFLPAVFVDAALRPWGTPEGKSATAVRVGAYGLSVAAAVLHVSRVLQGARAPSPEGLRVLAVGFWLLIPAVLWMAPRGARVRRGLVSAVALLAFGVCALHLSAHLPGSDTWSSAVFGHHASLPLVLAILYEDYRFAFADIFLKRALALILLGGIVLTLYVAVAAPVLSSGAEAGLHNVGLVLTLWIATAVCYPILQRAVNQLVDSAILRRPDYLQLRAEIAAAIGRLHTEEEILTRACRQLAPALSARTVEWVAEAGPQAPTAATVTVPIATTDPPHFLLRVGELIGGRRLLSDDSALLESVAALVARRLDSLRLMHERWERDLREQQIGKLATEAELRALQAQLNPHFLFNALNTIGYLMRGAPERAMATLLDLTQLLRAVLKRTGGEFVTLGQELELVRAYLAIEKARFEERLRVTIDVPSALRAQLIPPLVIQPLVENAIKHGVAPQAEGGELTLVARLEGEGLLTISVADSGVGASEAAISAGRLRGLGLSNIEKRLLAYYGARASLEVSSQPGHGTRALLRIPAEPADHSGTVGNDSAGAGARSRAVERV